MGPYWKMSKKKQIPNPRREAGRIPESVTVIKDKLKSGYPVLSFKHVSDNHCLLSDWISTEIKELISTFKMLEEVPWNKLHSTGLRLKAIDSFSKPLPPYISPDETIYEIRVCQKKRVFGYRTDDIFRVIWFDRNHEICPEGKSTKTYRY